MSHTRLASELAIRGGRAAALQNMNLHDSRDKRAVVLQKVVIQKLHGLHQGNRIRSRSSFFIKNFFFHKKVVCIENWIQF